MAKTATKETPLGGGKLYQQRARRAFPILVRQAEAGQTIFYSDLAEELGMANARNLNYPLGAIGLALERLRREWRERIPPIQCLVVNKHTGIPGEGIGWFLRNRDNFESLSRAQQREIVKAELAAVFAYRRWPEVLKAFSLKYARADFSASIRQAASFRGGGESEGHRRLKEFVARNPQVIGLANSTPKGDIEFLLASGDELDVSFNDRTEWTAAEVKSTNSPVSDVTRGLFQCVKYRAVMEAVQAASGLERNAKTVLVLEGRLPVELVPLRNILSVDVVENIVPR